MFSFVVDNLKSLQPEQFCSTASSYHDINLPKLPTNIIVDYDPDQCSANSPDAIFPMDDLGTVPITIVESTKLYNYNDETFDAVPSQELAELSANLRRKDYETLSESPKGTIEAFGELEQLRATYRNVTSTRNFNGPQMEQEISSRSGVMSCYRKIWNELRRRSKMGLNFMIFFIYNKRVVEPLIKLLTIDSFHVTQLACHGPEASRIYIAYTISETTFISQLDSLRRNTGNPNSQTPNSI